jgi:hypothetical protein
LVLARRSSQVGAASAMRWLVPLIESVPAILPKLSTAVLSAIYVGELSSTAPASIRSECRKALRTRLVEDTDEAGAAVLYFVQWLVSEPSEVRCSMVPFFVSFILCFESKPEVL